ncbi:CoA pyrophosphatase [Paludibacterium purpuratum]|uniref:8-oxo-dGTP pyrophosphatase MutT (NUDIX family) n=1 Tax=Paludibacterium purpuratum TaxID=1144873 RepID=A0A4R7BCA1_9NEIS|nr:CoA pyrophosphatase [Paludibacterium purpuratum]TDR82283.1 8-oxo-dGTP pyrophosphatase MutT (NUDIX family) [Paludibacterium purpuratum]
MLPSDGTAASDWIADRLAHGPDDRWREAMPPRLVFDQVCPAAVLIGLVWRSEGPTVLLTRRSDNLPTHPGQVSFPGGKQEAKDSSPIDTALREAEEEIGLDRGLVRVLGTLPRFVTITRFSVVPVVGFLEAPAELTPHPGEVAEIFEVPLAQVLRTDLYQRHAFEHDGIHGYTLSLSWQQHFIWGATAAMLRLLALTLSEPPGD